MYSIRGRAPSFNVLVVNCTTIEKSEWNPSSIEAGGYLAFHYRNTLSSEINASYAVFIIPCPAAKHKKQTLKGSFLFEFVPVLCNTGTNGAWKNHIFHAIFP